MIKDFIKFKTDIENKKFYPFYFITGDEPFYIDKASNLIENNIIEESNRAFNQITLYGDKCDAQKIFENVKRCPMLSDKLLVIVKEAQYLNEKEFEKILRYFEHPTPTTIFTLIYRNKKIDKRKLVFNKIIKIVKEKGIFFESSKLYESQIPSWIKNYTIEKGYKIEEKATVLLSEFLGNNLNKIANEIDKLSILLPKGSLITTENIEKNIGISKDYNNFELCNAIAYKNFKKAQRIAFYFAANEKKNPLTATIATLYNFFSKVLIAHGVKVNNKKEIASALGINHYFVNEYLVAKKNYSVSKIIKIFHYLREYDLKGKGVGNAYTDRGELLKELVFKIMN